MVRVSRHRRCPKGPERWCAPFASARTNLLIVLSSITSFLAPEKSTQPNTGAQSAPAAASSAMVVTASLGTYRDLSSIDRTHRRLAPLRAPERGRPPWATLASEAGAAEPLECRPLRTWSYLQPQDERTISDQGASRRRRSPRLLAGQVGGGACQLLRARAWSVSGQAVSRWPSPPPLSARTDGGTSQCAASFTWSAPPRPPPGGGRVPRPPPRRRESRRRARAWGYLGGGWPRRDP